MLSIQSKRELLKRSRLYAVLDTAVCDAAQLMCVAARCAEAGVGVIQLRDKSSRDDEFVTLANDLADLIGEESLFIVNDRLHLMKEIAADGVHLGQHDSSPVKARQLLGPEKLIGVSCQDLGHIERAVASGADYVGFGSVYKTQTKPGREPMSLDLLAQAAAFCRIPLFAIGGITPENVSPLLECGVGRIAVTRAVCEADDLEGVIARFNELMTGRKFAGVVQW